MLYPLLASAEAAIRWRCRKVRKQKKEKREFACQRRPRHSNAGLCTVLEQQRQISCPKLTQRRTRAAASNDDDEETDGPRDYLGGVVIVRSTKGERLDPLPNNDNDSDNDGKESEKKNSNGEDERNFEINFRQKKFSDAFIVVEHAPVVDVFFSQG